MPDPLSTNVDDKEIDVLVFLSWTLKQGSKGLLGAGRHEERIVHVNSRWDC